MADLKFTIKIRNSVKDIITEGDSEQVEEFTNELSSFMKSDKPFFKVIDTVGNLNLLGKYFLSNSCITIQKPSSDSSFSVSNLL